MKPQIIKDPQIVAFISTVRSKPALYDFRLPDHRNDELKESLWESVARESNMENGAEAKKLWQSLQQSFTIFYRNELIRLIRAHYDEALTATLPPPIEQPPSERLGRGVWSYYSDMRFIVPFRVKGADHELDRLIELAKPIVRSEALKSQIAPKGVANACGASQEGLGAENEPTLHHFDIPPVQNDSLSEEDLCLKSFFDAMFRATSALPKRLQRRVKRELLESLNRAESEAQQNEK